MLTGHMAAAQAQPGLGGCGYISTYPSTYLAHTYIYLSPISLSLRVVDMYAHHMIRVRVYAEQACLDSKPTKAFARLWKAHSMDHGMRKLYRRLDSRLVGVG